MPENLSEFDRERIGEIVGGMGDWFSAELLRLCAKADFENLAKLRLGFPDHVAAFLKWRGREDES